MSVLRVLAVLPLIAVLTGCAIEDLKSDVRALKVYLATTEVDPCKMPGQHDSSKTCLYKLQITDISGSPQGVYKGKIHQDVYKQNAKACPDVNKSLLPEYKSLAYDCAPLLDAQGNPTDFSKNSHFYPDTETEYTFHVDGNPMLSVGPNSVEFESIAGLKHLRKK